MLLKVSFNCINGEFATMQELKIRKACDLVIDARSEREYAGDYFPGALNLPIVNNEEYAE